MSGLSILITGILMFLGQCIVGQMNADEDQNKDIASEVGVSGFPTIKFFPKDGSEAVTYSSARSEQAFIDVSPLQ